jgi:KRAB domain-containing zinc finger protein
MLYRDINCCNICGKSYALGANLYVHKKSHSPDFKEFKCRLCKLCPVTFAESSGLRYHIDLHTGEKPFQCRCGSDFERKEDMTRHVGVYSDWSRVELVTFNCERCGTGFKGNEDQLRHVEKLIECMEYWC